MNMKKITSMTIFDDAVGTRLSLTYSEISEDGRIVSDNKRIDRILIDQDALAAKSELMEYAKTLID